MISYKNKWDDDGNCFWFYHTVEVNPETGTNPLVCKQFREIPKDMSCEVEDQDTSRLFMFAFQELAKSYGTWDLVEEYCAVKIFPVRASWTIAAWKEFSSPIKIFDFARSFNLTKDDIDVKDVEERANIILDPESAKEYNELEKRPDSSCSN